MASTLRVIWDQNTVIYITPMTCDYLLLLQLKTMHRYRHHHHLELWEITWVESNIIASSYYRKMKGNRIETWNHYHLQTLWGSNFIGSVATWGTKSLVVTKKNQTIKDCRKIPDGYWKEEKLVINLISRTKHI